MKLFVLLFIGLALGDQAFSADAKNACSTLQTSKALLDGTQTCPEAKRVVGAYLKDFPTFAKECQELETLVDSKKISPEDFRKKKTSLLKHLDPVPLEDIKVEALPKQCAKELEGAYRFRFDAMNAISQLRKKF